MEEKKKRGSVTEQIKNLVNNVWFILVCNCCSVIGLILTFTIDNIICRVIFGVLSFLFVFTVAFYLILRAFSIKKARYNIEATYEARSKRVYTHLKSYQNDLVDFARMIDHKSSIEEHTFKDKAALLCNRIEQIMTAALMTKEPVSVCIKCIKTETILCDDIEKWEIYTFARSASTQPDRLEYDREDRQPDRIVDNTDFEVIVSKSKKFEDFKCFYCGDLDTYPEYFKSKYEQGFKNSHSNPPYKSTIIVPIQVVRNRVAPILRKEISSTTHYHVIGFLCIDSEEKFIKSKDDQRYNIFTSCVNLVFAIGNSLYSFFEKYLIKELCSSPENVEQPAPAGTAK